jgi:hypothetical protein
MNFNFNINSIKKVKNKYAVNKIILMKRVVNKPNVHIDNLFKFCNDSKECTNVLYIIGENFSNTFIHLAINNDNKFIYKYSNEWLYLINVYYPSEYYIKLLELYSKTLLSKPNIIVNENVVSFITSFSLGTVHGYTGLFNNIIYYLDNIERFKNHKIIIYRESQKGMLDIIYYLVGNKVLDKDKFIFLEKNVYYYFSSVYFIENKHHIYTNELSELISTKFIDKYIKPHHCDTIYINSIFEQYNLPKNMDKILIMKGSNSIKLTSDGTFSNEHIINFKNRMNLVLIEPGFIDEIALIHIIQSCSIFVVSWGTSFFKNYIYISDKCKQIVVLVLENSNFYIQYTNSYNNNLIHTYKNAKITYIVTNPNLSNITI